MKRLSVLLLLFVSLLTITSCGQKEEILHMGLNAEIVDIDTDNTMLYVRDMDGESTVFGEKCALDCKKAIDAGKILYVNYEAEDGVRSIVFSDLMVGDAVIISLSDSEKECAKDNAAVAEQIQLATQRMN